MMLLNLWDRGKLAQKFMELYSLTGIQMCNILRRLRIDAEIDIIRIFCEETEIKLDEIDVVQNLEFLGKIVSTTVDDFKFLKQEGLVTLDVLLENDSPISQHLKKYEIEIKPSTHEMFYKGERLYIPFYNKDCEWCAYGYNQCKLSKNFCPYRNAISRLAIKLYTDNSEIEMFLMKSKEAMLEYSTVRNYPEIFFTIEDFVEEWSKTHLNIGNEWADIKQHSYIVTVPVRYNDLSYKNDYIDNNDGNDADNIFEEYKGFLSKTYDYLEQVPKCFWDNIWLINICLSLICPLEEAVKSICAGIKHDVVIPYDRLKIDLI